jgi:hypothetical protein
MNEREDYFRISKNGHVHTLSDRTPFRWKELMIFTPASFAFLIIFFGWFVGIFIAILTLICYTIYRFASWIYYSELKIDEKDGKLIRIKKILNRTHKTELIANKFDPNNFEYSELSRSGKTKFLMNYRTHKNNEILILRNEKDKNLIENYIKDKISVYNNL